MNETPERNEHDGRGQGYEPQRPDQSQPKSPPADAGSPQPGGSGHDYPGQPGYGQHPGYPQPGYGQHPGYPQPGYGGQQPGAAGDAHGSGQQPGDSPWSGSWPPAPGWGGHGGWGGGPPGSGWGHGPGYGQGGPWPPHQAPRRRGNRALAAVLAAAVVAAVAGVGIGHEVWQSSNTSSSASGPLSGGGSAVVPSPQGGGTFAPNSGGQFVPPNAGRGTPNGTTTSNAAGAPSNAAAIAAKVAPGLVDINTALSYQGAAAAGTGIVLTSNGEILTNNHVISQATKISVTDIGNGKTYAAKVVGYDRTADIAVLQLVGASNLTTASMGNSTKLSVGQPVVAIGNAGGTGGTPSSAGGSIVALNKSITASDQGTGTSERLTGLIQTNANIQPGDSGGSLVNTAGRVIGVDTAASAGFSLQTGGTEGFAIPINKALGIVKQIDSGNSSSTVHIGATAFLGVEVQAVPKPGSSPLGGGTLTPPSTGTAAPTLPTSGALVHRVVQNGPAANAGLVGGDIITSFGGNAVTSPTGLTAIIAGYHPGQSVQVAWTDQAGASHTATVTMASGPPA